MELPHPSPRRTPVPCQELTAQQRTPGNTSLSLLLATHQGFMLHAYIPLRNALQTSLEVHRTDLLLGNASA